MVLTYAGTQKQHFMFNYPRVPSAGCSSTTCSGTSASHVQLGPWLWQPLEQMVATTRGKFLQVNWDSAGNFTRPPPLSKVDTPKWKEILMKSLSWQASPPAVMMKPRPEVSLIASILPCGLPCFLPGFWTPRNRYIASSILRMNCSRFSVRRTYPFASPSWSNALKPWRWVGCAARAIALWISLCMAGPFNNSCQWGALEFGGAQKMTRFNNQIVWLYMCILIKFYMTQNLDYLLVFSEKPCQSLSDDSKHRQL